MQNYQQQARCLVRWANYELNDADEIDDPFQLLEQDGQRFTRLILKLCEKHSESANLLTLDDAIRWLSQKKLMVNLSLTDFYGKSDDAFLALLWNLVDHYIVDPTFGSLASEPNDRTTNHEPISMESISASAVRWAFSFAGPFVPRVLNQMKPDLSIIYDGKLLLSIVRQGSYLY